MIVVSRFLVSTVRLNRLWILLCPRIDETCRHFHSGFNNSIVIQYIFIRVRAWKKLKREREKIDKDAWINVRFVHLIRVINIYFCFFLFFFFFFSFFFFFLIADDDVQARYHLRKIIISQLSWITLLRRKGKFFLFDQDDKSS